jgi:hypothetical protein
MKLKGWKPRLLYTGGSFTLTQSVLMELQLHLFSVLPLPQWALIGAWVLFGKVRKLMVGIVYFPGRACTCQSMSNGGLSVLNLQSFDTALRWCFDKGMTHGSSILAYLVFGPGRASTEGMARPTSMIAWRSPGARLSMQCKTWRTRPSRIRTCLGFIQRDFYFRAPGSLVVLSFPQPLNFSSVFPSL